MHPGTPAHGNQEQQSTQSILTILDWIIDNVLQHKQAARPQDRIDQVTPNSLAWLRSNPVSWWYHGLAERHKRAFGTLLLHIASETCKIGARDGCYIALTYMVRIGLCVYAILLKELTPFCSLSGVRCWSRTLWSVHLHLLTGKSTHSVCTAARSISS